MLWAEIRIKTIFHHSQQQKVMSVKLYGTRLIERQREPVKVNRYIWQAALDVLDFMPIETIDPFSGVIVKGFGVPPGGKTQYRATIYVVDPALEARSLRVSMQTKSGPVSTATMNEIENAILSRARQMRKADGLS